MIADADQGDGFRMVQLQAAGRAPPFGEQGQAVKISRLVSLARASGHRSRLLSAVRVGALEGGPG
jgi:hypothetical protein